MKLVKRYDYESNVSAVTETTPEGFLKVMARATRVGVLKYRQADGSIVRELRHPDEVFSEESMQTLALKPLTNNHPTSLIDSESASLHSVGSTGETIKIVGRKFLDVMTVITDKKAIQDAANGKVEVSPGYVCELDFTPGVYEGEHYDAVQRNIRYNHLAIVKKGRSGPEVRLHLDADDAVRVELNQPKEKSKMKVKIDGKTFNLDDDAAEALDAERKKKKEEAEEQEEEAEKAKKDAKDAKAEMKDAKDKAKSAESDKDKAYAKADGLEAEIKKLKQQHLDAGNVDVKSLVKARAKLEKIASSAGVEKFDEMDDESLKKAVIKVDSPETDLTGKSADYVNARFDIAAESIEKADSAAKKLGERVGSGARETQVMDADGARAKMIERQQNAWKGERKEA